MAAFSTLLAATFIIYANAEKGKYGDCSYIVEANDGIYDSVLDAAYANLSLPTRAYTMDNCNYFYDYDESRHISWSYSCDAENDEVTVSFYPGDINACTIIDPPATYKYTRANNPDIDWYCGTQDCTLTIQRWHNEGNETCEDDANTFPLNTYSIVNGQCEMGNDIGYYLSASCENATDAYDYGFYGDDECAGQAGQSGEVSSDSCPSEKDGYPNAIGSLRYRIMECMGDPYEPTTTLPASTDMGKCDGDYLVGGDCSADDSAGLCTETLCYDCKYTNGEQICNDQGATCTTELSEDCDCVEVWATEDGTEVTCDTEEEDVCVAYMVKMAFITIIVSWLWI